MLESGGDTAKLEQKIKVMDLTKENSSLREQIKELELVAMDLMRDLQDVKEKTEVKGPTTYTPPPTKSPRNGSKTGVKKDVPRTGPPKTAGSTTSAAPKKTSGAEEKDVSDLKKKLKEQDLKIKALTAELQRKRSPEAGDTTNNSELKFENDKLKEEMKELKKISK